jgi:hypothetical protein
VLAGIIGDEKTCRRPQFTGAVRNVTKFKMCNLACQGTRAATESRFQ